MARVYKSSTLENSYDQKLGRRASRYFIKVGERKAGTPVSFASENRGFNAEIFSCVDKTLGSILGEDAKTAMYHMISKNYDFPPERFRSKPLELCQYLGKALGETGYAVIERAIIREIIRKFKLDGGVGLTLQSAVDQARAEFLKGAEKFEVEE